MTYSNNTGYPSVTQILRPLVNTDYFKEEHSTRGQKVHAACAAYVQDLFVGDLPKDCQPYFESFIKWMNTFRRSFSVCLVEKRLIDKKRGYCGQVDLVCEIDGDPWVIDLKTSQEKNNDWWPLQLAGYAALACEDVGVPTIRRASLRLKKDGSGCLFDEYSNKMDIYKFWELLNIFKSGATMSEETIDFEAAIPKGINPDVIDTNLPATKDPFDKSLVVSVFDNFKFAISAMKSNAENLAVLMISLILRKWSLFLFLKFHF